jgi:3-oxoacyl-[acyl-carrier-protein] synthase III
METVLGMTKVDAVIQYLNAIEIDGETTEYLLEKINMREQMLRQLIMSSSNEVILELLKEKLRVPELQFQISE